MLEKCTLAWTRPMLPKALPPPFNGPPLVVGFRLTWLFFFDFYFSKSSRFNTPPTNSLCSKLECFVTNNCVLNTSGHHKQCHRVIGVGSRIEECFCLMCVLRFDFVENVFLHWLQVYRTPSCIDFMCFCRLDLDVNEPLQNSHSNFTFSWTDRMCCVRSLFWANDLPQNSISHLNGRNFKWTALMCRCKACLDKNLLPHSSQRISSPSCSVLMCWVKVLFAE